jgi:hypothetical protein
MKTRLASLCDARQLARIHRISSLGQPGGFMFKLGRSFLAQYYRILLREKNSVVLCAEGNQGEILGLVSGTLDAREHAAALRRRWLWLMMGALPAVIRSPGLVLELHSRQRSLAAVSDGQGYIVQEGARLEYWAWLHNHKPTMGAVPLLQKWLAIMNLMGANSIKHEVDEINQKSIQIHSLLGSQIKGEFMTKDGRKRLIMEYYFSDVLPQDLAKRRG